jgi:hypothetical protein
MAEFSIDVLALYFWQIAIIKINTLLEVWFNGFALGLKFAYLNCMVLFRITFEIFFLF